MDNQSLLLYLGLASIAVLLILIVYYSLQVVASRRRLRKETEEALSALSQNFKSLRDEFEKEIAYLDGKEELSLQESLTYKKLKESFDESEKYITKEIKDIEKELK
ncbi:MAG: hypothetical protein WC397_00010 [Candidatus Paceibacterota bacterium]|jgi:vacuolar-type H+-ATPase subunit B/Vma2